MLGIDLPPIENAPEQPVPLLPAEETGDILRMQKEPKQPDLQPPDNEPSPMPRRRPEVPSNTPKLLRRKRLDDVLLLAKEVCKERVHVVEGVATTGDLGHAHPIGIGLRHRTYIDLGASAKIALSDLLQRAARLRSPVMTLFSQQAKIEVNGAHQPLHAPDLHRVRGRRPRIEPPGCSKKVEGKQE